MQVRESLMQVENLRESEAALNKYVENLKLHDPFAEADSQSGAFDVAGKGSFVHIRIQQRSGRKTLTTVQGLASDLNLKKILKFFKKEFCCNGTIVRDPELGKVIQVQGDQRQNIFNFLTQENICEKSQVKIHGF